MNKGMLHDLSKDSGSLNIFLDARKMPIAAAATNSLNITERKKKNESLKV